MTVTVSGKNYTQISSCDTALSGGTWTGVTVVDSADKKQGVASLCGTLKAAGNNDTTFVPTDPVDLSGTKHVHFWFLITSGSLVNLYANGGIQFWASDGTNTGYWYVGGRDTYPGGWHNFVVDVSKEVDSGTKPSNMGSITSMGTRHNLTAIGKNVTNTWIDNLCVCDGLITYGDDVGDYYDFENIFAICDDPAIGGWGILTKKAGVFCLAGSIEFGDALGSNSTKFQAKSQTIVFENRPNKNGTLSNIHMDLMKFTVVDNGTGTTEFILGDKSGGVGIAGCAIRTQNLAQLAKYKIDGSGANVDNFKLYGSSFFDADSIVLPAHATNVEIRNCSFEESGEIDIRDAVFENNVVSSAISGVLYAGMGTRRAKNNSYLACSDGMHFDTAQEITLDGDRFAGNTYDVHFSGSGTLTVNNSNDSNASSSRASGGGTVVIQAAVTIRVEGLTEGAACKCIANETVGTITKGDVIFEKLADSDGVAEKTDFVYQSAFDPTGLDVLIRTAQQGLPNAAIQDDNGSYTDYMTEANSTTIDDMILYPVVPAVNQDSFLLAHPEQFNRLKIELSTVGSGGFGVTWEYWNGAWTALSGVVDGTGNLTLLGERIVSWTTPGDWAKTTVNSQGPFYYVRARYTSGTMSTVPLGRKCQLDVNRYFTSELRRVVSSTGLMTTANHIPDIIAKFDPND